MKNIKEDFAKRIMESDYKGCDVEIDDIYNWIDDDTSQVRQRYIKYLENKIEENTMKELELLQEVIRDLEYLEEREVEVCDKQGYFSHYMTHMGYFDKEDRDEMIKKLKEVYDTLKEREAK